MSTTRISRKETLHLLQEILTIDRSRLRKLTRAIGTNLNASSPLRQDIADKLSIKKGCLVSQVWQDGPFTLTLDEYKKSLPERNLLESEAPITIISEKMTSKNCARKMSSRAEEELKDLEFFGISNVVPIWLSRIWNVVLKFNPLSVPIWLSRISNVVLIGRELSILWESTH
jgi:hypothetical protein